MPKTLISIVLTALFTAIPTFYFTGVLFRSVIQEETEEEILQDTAFVQILLEILDKGDSDQLRKEIDSQMTNLLSMSNPGDFYKYKTEEACKLYQLIYKYRKQNKHYYIKGNTEEELSQKTLEYWSNKGCGK